MSSGVRGKAVIEGVKRWWARVLSLCVWKGDVRSVSLFTVDRYKWKVTPLKDLFTVQSNEPRVESPSLVVSSSFFEKWTQVLCKQINSADIKIHLQATLNVANNFTRQASVI